MTDQSPEQTTEDVTPEMIAAGFEVIEEELGQSSDYVTYHLTDEHLAKLFIAMRRLEIARAK